MLPYLYYGYLGYLTVRYIHILEYGYTAIEYSSKIKHAYSWLFDKPEIKYENEDMDWVLCDLDDDNVLTN